MYYAVNDVYATIQGEGVLAGVPMVVVRLQGCSVGCRFCDTKETWAKDDDDVREQFFGQNRTWGKMRPYALAGCAAQLARLNDQRIDWVMLTGGEPCEQDIAELCAEIHRQGLKVALETSGTANGCFGAEVDWYTCSPKVGQPGGKPLLASCFRKADEIKQVVCGGDDVRTLERMIGTYGTRRGAVISLQPVSQSEKATRLCIQEAQRHGWRVSLQMHKYLGLR